MITAMTSHSRFPRIVTALGRKGTSTSPATPQARRRDGRVLTDAVERERVGNGYNAHHLF